MDHKLVRKINILWNNILMYDKEANYYLLTIKPSDRGLNQLGITSAEFMQQLEFFLENQNKDFYFIQEIGKTGKVHYHGIIKHNTDYQHTKKQINNTIKQTWSYLQYEYKIITFLKKQRTPVSCMIRKITPGEIHLKEVFMYTNKDYWDTPHDEIYGSSEFYNKLYELFYHDT